MNTPSPHRPPRIVVVGSANRDLSVRVQALPHRGETVLGDRFAAVAGGKGANQAVAAARAGADVIFVGCVGADAFGSELAAGLEAEGIDTGHLAVEPEVATGVALILVDERGDNCITVAPGANAALTPEHVADAEDAIAQADVVLIQLEIPVETATSAAALAHRHGVRVVLNPAPARELPAELLHRVTVITPNETEALFYTGVAVENGAAAKTAAEALLALGPRIAIVTMGAAGAYYCDPTTCEGVAQAYRVDAVDSTAAGDVFNGSLVVHLAEGRSLREAVEGANAAAALSVTRLGAQDAAPARHEVAAFMAHNQPISTNGALHAAP